MRLSSNPNDRLFQNIYDAIYNDFFNTNRKEVVSISAGREEYRINGIKTVCIIVDNEVFRIDIERDI